MTQNHDEYSSVPVLESTRSVFLPVLRRSSMCTTRTKRRAVWAFTIKYKSKEVLLYKDER